MFCQGNSLWICLCACRCLFRGTSERLDCALRESNHPDPETCLVGVQKRRRRETYCFMLLHKIGGILLSRDKPLLACVEAVCFFFFFFFFLFHSLSFFSVCQHHMVFRQQFHTYYRSQLLVPRQTRHLAIRHRLLLSCAEFPFVETCRVSVIDICACTRLDMIFSGVTQEKHPINS